MVRESAITRIQRFVHDVLGGGERKGPWATTITWFLLAIIVLNVLAFALETVEPIAHRYGAWFDFILYVSIGLFSLEYLLRAWACTLDDSGLYSHPLRGRLRFMLTPLSLIDLAVILPLVLAVYVWLRWRGERRQANYWLAAGAFAILAGPLIKVLLQVPRPDIGLTGLSPWAFPSSHTLRATVVYGFLAVSLSASMTQAWRWLPYVWAVTLIVAVSISRLYFGAHWLTDVIGSLALGLTWVAALGLAYRRHTRDNTTWRGLGLTALCTLAIAFGAQTAISHGSDLALYRPQPQVETVSEEDWQANLWRALPRSRDDLRKEKSHPLNLQYAGRLVDLQTALAPMGWEPGTKLGWGTAMKLSMPAL